MSFREIHAPLGSGPEDQIQDYWVWKHRLQHIHTWSQVRIANRSTKYSYIQSALYWRMQKLFTTASFLKTCNRVDLKPRTHVCSMMCWWLICHVYGKISQTCTKVQSMLGKWGTHFATLPASVPWWEDKCWFHHQHLEAPHMEPL